MMRSRDRYSVVAIVLHWTIALLILLNLYVGLKMGGLSPGAPGFARVDLIKLGPLVIGWSEKGIAGLIRFQVFQLHKSIGFTVLALSLIRLAWRLANPPPPEPTHMKRWEKLTAGAVHWGFYVIMIGLPLTGWVIVSASPTNIPTLLYKTVPVPHLGFIHAMAMDTRKMLEDQVGDIHTLMAWGTMLLIVLHVGAALKHQLLDRDGLLFRMIPFKGLGVRA